MGIDVEKVRQRQGVLSIADRYFTTEEAAALHRQAKDAQLRRFLEYWTLKEAYVKARGMGFSHPLNSFGFDVEEPGKIRAWFEAGGGQPSKKWHFWQAMPVPDYLLAVCVERSGAAVPEVVVRRMVPMEREEQLEVAVLRQTI